MFFYFYDSFVLNNKNEATLTRVESRIIELGINGRVEKLAPLRNMKELLQDGIKRGAHTVVVVGDDATFLRTVNIVAGQDIVLGYIPFGKESALAKVFGIPDTFEACNILSRRIIKELNVGKANKNYFLTSAKLEHTDGLQITCDEQFTVSGRIQPTSCHIHNLGNILSSPVKEALIDTTNNKLVLDMQPNTKKRSLLGRKNSSSSATGGSTLLVRKAELRHEHEPIAVTLDNATTIKTPVTISVRPKQLKVIVGKERMMT